MNKDLYHLYQDLDPRHKTTINETFAAAPKMLQLINLLTTQGKNLSTIKAVNTLYYDEIDTQPFQKLTNRFYKLRQELKEWLLVQLKDSPACFTDTERELSYLQLLVIKNEYSHAFEKLLKLEEQCWKLNLFELLPQILELCIRCIQTLEFKNFERQKIYVEKYKEAQKLFLLAKELRGFGFAMLYEQDIEQILQTMRRLIKPYSKYPRFKKIYHYLAFRRSIFLPNPQYNAISRHLNSYKKLLMADPEMPCLQYEQHHIERTSFAFYESEATYWALRNDFKKAAQLLKEREEFIDLHKEIYVKVTERELHNYAIIYTNAGAYEAALTYIQKIKEFQEEHKEMDIIYPYYYNELDLYGSAFAKTSCPNPTELIQKIDHYLNSLAGRPKALLLTMKFKFWVAQRDWEAAQELLKMPELVNFFNTHLDIDDFLAHFHSLISAITKQKIADLQALAALCKQQKKTNQLSISNIFWSLYHWIEQVSKFYIKKYRYY